jgi:hypothetical protein
MTSLKIITSTKNHSLIMSFLPFPSPFPSSIPTSIPTIAPFVPLSQHQQEQLSLPQKKKEEEQEQEQAPQQTQDLFEDLDLTSSFDERNRQPSWSELHDELDQFGPARMVQKYGPDILKELGYDSNSGNSGSSSDMMIPGAQPQPPSDVPVFFDDSDQSHAKWAEVTFPNGTHARVGPFYSNHELLNFLQLLNF